MFYNSHSKIFSAHSEDGYTWKKLGGWGIKGADVDAFYLADGTIRVYFGDYSENTSGVVYTGILKEVAGPSKNTEVPGAPNSVDGPKGNLPPPPQECVGKKATDSNLPESCNMWFKLQKSPAL